ncbi:hypothetical protein ACIBTZ_18950 [Micromonospora sp. NPDC049460]|uniref:hypothetical protein n=1 Tax=Micromonospora sp. NPDC049460 TaxID=3364272 RepID=UPI00378ABF6C
MADVDVDVQAVRRLEAAAKQVAASLTALESRIASAGDVPDGAFGHLPFVSDLLREKYAEQVSGGTGQKYADKRRAAGDPDKWFHKFTDPAKGSWKLGKPGTPFDMSTFERVGALRAHGMADGARMIGRDFVSNLPWNVPNAVVHGATWGTVAVVSGLFVPGTDQLDDKIDGAVAGGAEWIDPNVFG